MSATDGTEAPHAEAEAPSRTAAGVAWLRAAHQLIDGTPKILDDPAVVALLGPDGAERVLAERERAQSAGARALRSHVVLRSRWAEDRLRDAVERGVRRYVILGAGYDTFVVRQPAWARDLCVVEVDRGAIQRAKRTRLAQVGLVPPANASFVEVDFERETLAAALGRARLAADVPTFFSWLGVTMYLTEPAIDAVLRTVASYAPRSEIVFSFAQPAERETPRDVPTLAERAAALGEPWLSYFTPDQIERKLRGFGFACVEFLTPEQAAAAYFAGRDDGLPAPRRTSLVAARV